MVLSRYRVSPYIIGQSHHQKVWDWPPCGDLVGTPWKKTGKREKSGLPSEPAMAHEEISLSSMGPERFIY
jgi:hypothetical protein